MEYWVFAVVVLVVLVMLYLYGTCTFGTFEGLGLKGPKPLPFFGNFLEMLKRKPLNFYHENTLKYGNMWVFFKGRRPTIVVTEPDMLRQILVKEFNNFVNRDVVRVSKSKGLLPAFDGDWKRIRTILTPTFSSMRMKQMLPLIADSTKRLVQIFQEAANSKECTDVTGVYGRFTMEVILSAAFGVQADTQRDAKDPYTVLAADFFKGDPVVALLHFCFPLLVPLYVAIFPVKGVVGLRKVAEQIIQARRSASTVKRKDLLQLMLMSSGEEGDTKDPLKSLSDDEMVDQSVTFLLAGSETTSAALSFVSYALAINPDVQEKLLADIDELFPDDQIPEYDQLQNIPYLDMVINESLRLYPPVFRFDRVSKKECVINGLRIPKDVIVLVPTYTLHRDPDYWPEPEKFDPMRFSPEAKAKQHPYAFLPFGVGPRNCIGMRFALMEAKMALVMILKQFRFERAPETEDPPTLKGFITIIPANGCCVYIRHRKPKEE